MTKRVSLSATILSLGFLSVAIYAAGCGSDSSNGTGGAGGGKGGSSAIGGKGGSAAGGKGGTAAGGSAAGGSNGGAAGGANGGAAGGANGGAAGGANGGAAGGKAGAAGGAGGTAAGGAGGSSLAASLCPSTGGMYTASSTMKMSANDFCDLFLATCGSTVAGHTTRAECMSTYAASQNMTVASGGSQNGTIGACESYHLCNAAQGSASVHCPHAAGTAICVP